MAWVAIIFILLAISIGRTLDLRVCKRDLKLLFYLARDLTSIVACDWLVSEALQPSGSSQPIWENRAVPWSCSVVDDTAIRSELESFFIPLSGKELRE
jgi:hypothetical protein